MTRASKVRTQHCGTPQALKRLADARKFLEVAEMVDDEPLSSSAGVSAALAVLSGIAASDAACCAKLGKRPRGDHNEAPDVLSQVAGSADAVKALKRLLSIKNDAEYGLTNITMTTRNTAIRQATKLLDFAEDATTS